MMKNLILLLSLLMPALALASEGAHLDRAPINMANTASLQRGVKVFVNYCLNCHSAASMRYNRLHDIGLSDAQIKANLLFAGEKVGETMTIAMNKKDGKAWLGAAPPDLSVIARARGADWLYTYLRSFYRDDTRPTGWNNVVFPNVGMPHALWQLQGEQRLKVAEQTGEHVAMTVEHMLILDKPGTLSPAEYDALVADLVNYLVFMGEPAKMQRMQLGIIVLLFLSLFFVVTLYLKKEFWKDVH
jgi:ubiquinol-cytochrome c reductase cytochrome c1 subunit